MCISGRWCSCGGPAAEGPCDAAAAPCAAAAAPCAAAAAPCAAAATATAAASCLQESGQRVPLSCRSPAAAEVVAEGGLTVAYGKGGARGASMAFGRAGLGACKERQRGRGDIASNNTLRRSE